MKLSKLKYNPENPRRISPEQLDKLVKSIESLPKMMELRPIVYDPNTMYVLGGNQRLAALRKMGKTEIPDTWVKSTDEMTEKEKREFVLRDNVQAGEWDYSVLDENFADFDLDDIGIELPSFADDDTETEEDENPYTQKIETPVYEIKGEKPELSELVNTAKHDELIKEIDKSDAPEEVKSFLRTAAQRHTVFDYGKIAEYYAHAPADIQRLMERSALVIIDFNDAIANGYIRVSKEIAELYRDEYGDVER